MAACDLDRALWIGAPPPAGPLGADELASLALGWLAKEA
jgi:hypothetical protein